MNKVEQRGWFSNVPANGRVTRPEHQLNNDNVAGLGASQPDIVIETTPEHRNLIAGDLECAGWTRRSDDPGVVARREHLRQHNGIADLEMVAPNQVERAAELFHRDGFVVVTNVLTDERFDALKAATDRVVDEILLVDPDGSVGGGAGGLPHRYSFGRASASRHQLHDPAWVDVIDLETTTPILTSIFGSNTYVVGGAGGGCMPYQQWERLTDHGKRISRYVGCGPGERVVGAGFNHPKEAERDRYVSRELDELRASGSHQAHDWWLRR